MTQVRRALVGCAVLYALLFALHLGAQIPSYPTGVNPSNNPQVYIGGILKTGVRVYTGTQALTAGSATHTLGNSFSFSGVSSFNCWATDTAATAAAANATPASATTVTVKGSGTDTIALLCIGT